MFSLVVYVPINFLPDALIKEHGISSIKAGNIIAFYGISNIIGSIISGMILNYLEKCAVLLTFICMTGLALSCIGMAFSVVYWQYVLCSCIYGFFLRGVSASIPISLVDMFGIDYLKFSYGVIMFGWTFSALVGPPFVGKLKVIWGSYDFAFIVAGGFHFVGASFVLIVVILTWRQRQKDSPKSKVSPQKREINGNYGST